MTAYNNLIVFDTNIQAFHNNLIFDPAYSINFPGAQMISCLGNIARCNGWDILTGDIFIRQKPSFKKAVCLSDEITPLLNRLIDFGVELKVLTSGESPNIAWSFYHNLYHFSRLFKHTLIFRGFASRVHPSSEFHEYYWPNAYHSMLEGSSWHDRRLLGMVTSCKSRVNINRLRLVSRLISPLRRLKILLYQVIDRMLRFRDLYDLRFIAIEKFAQKSEFHLYGKGWIEAQRSWSRIKCINFANPPAACQNKVAALSNFKFALCFENCVYPGYLTEKIFDAFFAGTVPVYLGAPDVADFIPISCFIDYRNFSTLEDLWKFLETLKQRRWQDYREEIKLFLASERFLPFRQESVAEKLFRWLSDTY